MSYHADFSCVHVSELFNFAVKRVQEITHYFSLDYVYICPELIQLDSAGAGHCGKVLSMDQCLRLWKALDTALCRHDA